MGFIIFILIVVGLILLFNKKTEHQCKNGQPHVWGKWKPWGYTYQERSCDVCGWSQRKDK